MSTLRLHDKEFFFKGKFVFVEFVNLEKIVCYIYCGGEQFTGTFMLTQIHPHGITQIANSDSYFFNCACTSQALDILL